MKSIIIVGAGGHGKVILDILLKMKKISKDNFEILGFLDDKKKDAIIGYPILGDLDGIKKLKENEKNFFVIAFGKNELREKIEKKNSNLKYITVIDPSVILGAECEIGDGTVIKANCVISPGTKIGKHCIINSLVSVEQDTVIEDFVHIYPNVSIYGENIIKKGITIFSNASTENGVIIYKDLNYGEHLKAIEGEN